MTRKFKITVDGRSYAVAVEDVEAQDDPAAPAPAASRQAPPPPKPAEVAQPAVEPAPTAAVPGTITAPIGGMVRSIEVEIGSEVKVGETVAIIEAMKMKTEIKSTASGKVETISARVNESVETGQAIMTLAA
jgi:biotin carboxyl carrier protein